MVKKKKFNPGDWWYKEAVIYELHIKAFRDSNADGIGDFGGLLEKLEYLRDLGVNTIWLLPFYPSPLKDDGYDIADYYTINPSYGTIRQFKKFMLEAHRLNLKVITELVLNHTSDQHPWFQRARTSPKNSEFRDYYVWSDDPQQYKDARIIFQDFEPSNWTWDPVAEQYYWHRFYHHQPDLNYDNPRVKEEVLRVLDFWCEMGVDGFRLDAVPYLYERENTNCENLPETHAFLKELRKHVDKNYPGTLLLAEANMWPEDSVAYFGNGDECQMNYHFPLMPRIFMSLQMEDRYPITDIFDQTPPIPANCQWAIFLRNHDELTLEMVTDEERDYMYKVYVKDPKARINLGIRHRLAPLMGNNRKKIELVNYLLFSLPGTPVIYYGDEIGMGDNFYLGDRDGVRTPMQWNSDKNAGFSNANPQKLYLPLILDPEYSYEAVNVELQSRNPSSLLWWMKRVISFRKKYRSLSHGDLQIISGDNPKILAFTRTNGDETMLIVTNLSRYFQPVKLQLDNYKGAVPIEIFSKNRFPAVNEESAYYLTLGAYDCLWFVLEKAPGTEKKGSLPETRIDDWDHLLTGKRLDDLETTILPDYLRKMRWFGGKARGIESIKVDDQCILPAGKKGVVLLLLDVKYYSGLPETYQLGFTFASRKSGALLRQQHPNSIICKAVFNGEDGYLYDAVFNQDFREFLLEKMVSSKTISFEKADLRFSGVASLKKSVKTIRKMKSSIIGADQSNTSINYSNKYFLKIYRKVDRSTNPDLELTYFLSEKARFSNIPSYKGGIEWLGRQDSIVLGMMTELVQDSQDAWLHTIDRVDRYYEKILAAEKGKLRIGKNKHDLINPVSYDEAPPQIRELIEAEFVRQISLLGVRTAEMHLALASEHRRQEFKPEPFSLHYQRSLYSSFVSLVRSCFQNLESVMEKLPPGTKKEAAAIRGRKDEILQLFKAIYKKKFDIVKIRIHGDYHLGQVLFTGKDFLLLDFEGEPARTYSERRLKRSPLRDVAGMMRSIHYAAYGALLLDHKAREEDIQKLLPFAEQWYQFVSGFYLQAYLETVQASPFVPAAKEDLEVLLKTYLMEKAIYELNYELNNRPDWVMVPLKGIEALLEQNHKV